MSEQEILPEPKLGSGHVPVVLREYPLALGVEQEEYRDALVREFQLLVLGEEYGEHSAPRRLLAVAEEMVGRYHAELEGPRRAREEALARGETHADITYQAPPETLEVLERWEETYELVDSYCESGALLSLATPPQLRELRRWGFHEFRSQLRGGAPTPWPAWVARRTSIQAALEADVEAGAHYLRLAEIPPGAAVAQRSLTTPTGAELVVDFDEAGRVVGLEFLDPRSLPPLSSQA